MVPAATYRRVCGLFGPFPTACVVGGAGVTARQRVFERLRGIVEPRQAAGPGKEVSEKSLELNVCAELLQGIRTVPGCEGALWLGLTQRQERRTGLDEFIHNVGPGMALMLQFKAPWRTSVVDHLYKFSINERQHEALEPLAARYPEAVHYVFPFFSRWSKAKEYAPDLVQDTWLVPVSSIPLAALQAVSSPKTGRTALNWSERAQGSFRRSTPHASWERL